MREAPAQQEADVEASAIAQQMDIDDLDALLPAHLRTPLPVAEEDVAEEPIVRTKAVPTTPPSPIEKFYRDASADQTLQQFGYDFFGTQSNNAIAPASGAVSDDYVLGASDRLTIAFLGERKDRASYSIDRTGALNIDMLPPIAASGKTLGQLRSDIQKLLEAQAYHGDVYVSLERVRQISVLVAGHVKTPGRLTMTPMQTALEAIEQSGGVARTGSLRQIRLIRGGVATNIDLYPVMGAFEAATALPPLRDGDRIIVPPLGSTFAVSGDVRQPGIYELAVDGGTDVAAALQMAGGMMAQGRNRVAMLVPQKSGQRVARMTTPAARDILSDGTILSITRTDDFNAASFTLSGETREAGTYAIKQYPKLSKLLRSPQAFGDDIYPLIGVVSRQRKTDLARDLIAFSPQDVYMGRSDVPLQDNDAVTLLSRKDVQSVMKRQATELNPLTVTFLEEHVISLQGAVRLPGNWPVAGPVAVGRVLDVAGGTLSDADLSRAEINRNDVGLIHVSAGMVSHRDTVDITDGASESVTVTFGDAVRIPDRFEAVTRQTVLLQGEVRNPGTYDLMRGDTLLTLIDRAGGLTDQAYPLGTVFSRASERKREKEKFSIAARDLERAVAQAAQDDDGKVNAEQMELAKELAGELKTVDPIGRITVESDPGVLRRDPALDILLEAADRIYIPKRPLSVRVTGEVLSPASLQFRADKKTPDYIGEAGGLTQNADSGRIFVLFPNGAARPVRKTDWASVKPLMIIPGSTIVVPRDPKPFDFIESAKDITQILSNVAITGIYADDLMGKD